MLRLARRAISAAAPPDLLDLSLLQPGDAWVEPARAVARALPADDVAPLVRALGRLGGGQAVANMAAGRGGSAAAAAGELVKRWLELAADTDVTQPEPDGARLLFAYGNDDVVRALVYATGLLPREPWVPGVLGVLARRGAAPPECGIAASLSLKVASAAVDSLIARGTPADRAVLEQLLEDLSRRDLVKRIGTALGRGAEVADRDAALRRTKAAAVRRKANPVPRQERAAADRRSAGTSPRRCAERASPAATGGGCACRPIVWTRSGLALANNRSTCPTEPGSTLPIPRRIPIRSSEPTQPEVDTSTCC